MRRVVGFGESDLRSLAGPRSFERGRGYRDAVSGLEVGDGWFTAIVHGTGRYEVELTEDGEGGLDGVCDCPYGQEGNFCKHCVAVGLVVLGMAREVPAQRSVAASRGQGLEAWLESLSRAELLDLVREQLSGSREVRRRLELRAATARSDAPVVRERVLMLLDPAPFAQYGYVEYADAHAYSRQAAEAVTALRTLTEQGQGAQAVVLAREVITVLDGKGSWVHIPPSRHRSEGPWEHPRGPLTSAADISENVASKTGSEILHNCPYSDVTCWSGREVITCT